MVTTKSHLLITEVWSDLLTDMAEAIKSCQRNGTTTNMRVEFAGSGFYLYGEGAYSVSTLVIPVPVVAGKYKITNPSGTTKQLLPTWNSSGKWIALGTEIIVVALITNEDEQWLVLEKNGGFVSNSRATFVQG